MMEMVIPTKPNTSNKVTLNDVKNFFKDKGLIGEENNACIVMIGLLRLQNILIESESGAGKSMISDTALMLLPKEYVYKLEFTSKTGLMYDQEIFNKARIVYIPELQKAYSDMNVDILKSLTEKKNVDRKVTKMMDFSGGKPKFGGVSKQHLRGDNKCILSTLALENKMKKDEELNRRILTIHTDISAEQNERVVKAIGKTRFKKNRLKFIEEPSLIALKQHCKEVLELPEMIYENPFSEFITNKIPSGFIIVRSYVKHYLDLMEGVTKFYHKNRLKKDSIIFVNIQDIILLHELYSTLFNQKIHHLPQLGVPIMSCFKEKDIGYKRNKDTKYAFINETDEERTYLTTMELHKALKLKSMLLKHKVIEEQCEVLVEAGFLGKEMSGKKVLYYQTDEVTSFEDCFDWKTCLEDGQRLMKRHYPEYYNAWNNLNDLSVVKEVEKKTIEKQKQEEVMVNGLHVEKAIIEIVKMFGSKSFEELSLIYGDKVLEGLIKKGDLFEQPKGTLRVLE